MNSNFKQLEESHVSDNIMERVTLTIKDSNRLSAYIQDAILSLTFDDGFNVSNFVEAIQHGDSENVGRMLLDRITTLVESDVVADLVDEVRTAEAICERYDRDTSFDDHFI